MICCQASSLELVLERGFRLTRPKSSSVSTSYMTYNRESFLLSTANIDEVSCITLAPYPSHAQMFAARLGDSHARNPRKLCSGGSVVTQLPLLGRQPLGCDCPPCSLVRWGWDGFPSPMISTCCLPTPCTCLVRQAAPLELYQQPLLDS